MATNVQQALRGEQALGPNRSGYDMEPKFARVHELGLAVLELKETWRRSDPYLAATATAGQVQPSADVQQHADAQAFQQVATQIDPNYQAADAAPREAVVQAAPAIQMQPQSEQARI